MNENFGQQTKGVKMKRKNVDRSMVDFMMDFVEDKEVSIETVTTIHQKVGSHLRKIDKREQLKIMRKLKSGHPVKFIDHTGTERSGIVAKKDRKDVLVSVRVDGDRQLWRVEPRFFKTKGK